MKQVNTTYNTWKIKRLQTSFWLRSLLVSLLATLSPLLIAQNCSTTSGVDCRCLDTNQVNCDLLPDLTVSVKILTDTGGYIEYPQHNAVSMYPTLSDDGKLRLSVGVPNIGNGPLEIKAINYFTCGNDTSLGNPGVCPDGSQPKGLVNQLVFHKIADSMTYYLHNAGAMAYHPLHSHFHVDDFAYYTLRIKKNGEPNPLKWPIVGQTTKNSFCLEDGANCSSCIGCCKDSLDNTLLDSNFVNFGMGGPDYYTCGSGTQGISPGFFDVYSKEYWGMWIDIPPGTCNGNYYIVIQIDPLNHFLESNKKNNVAAVPITLTKQDTAGNPLATIYPEGFTTFCQGDSLKLTANAGYSYVWSTGDTLQSITVKQSGTYSVTVTSSCGTASSTPVTVTVLAVPPLATVTGDNICKNDTALLQATGTDSLIWYLNTISENRINTGTTYKTPPLAQTTTYYVENVKRISGSSFVTGKTDTAGGGRYYAANGYIMFDCVSPFTLNAITLYTSDTGTTVIKLLDWSGYLIYSKVILLAKGKNRVVLDVPVFKENNYMLTVSGDSIYFGNTGNVNYPYQVAGVLNIHSSTFGNDTYPYFYEWEIKTFDLMCSSGRVPVTALVNSGCTVGMNTYKQSQMQVNVFPNPAVESTTVTLQGCETAARYSFRLYDVFGKEVHVRYLTPNGTTTIKFNINRNDFSAGLYFYKIASSVVDKQDSELLYAGKIVFTQ